MADLNDRDRTRRRKRRGRGKEREKEFIPGAPPPRPHFILAKPPSERSNSISESVNNDIGLSSSLEKQQPVVIVKSRDDDLSASSSTGIQVIPSLLAADSLPQQVYPQRSPGILTAGTIRIEGSSHARLAPPSDMKHAIKLVDDNFNWCDSGMDMLVDQTGFVTVGVIGLQGSGKSTVASLLAGNTSSGIRKSSVFRCQTREERETCCQQTLGIDMFVTNERMIILDTQPLLSSAGLDHMIHNDKKYSAEYSSVENCVEIQSLQLTSFMMTVCNVVVVVIDWFVDANLLRFLQTAEMLKPPTPAPSHETSDLNSEYYPDIVFLLNRARREDFSVESQCRMQAAIAAIFNKSNLKYRGQVSLMTETLFPGIPVDRLPGDVSLFVLPSMETNNNGTKGVFSLIPNYRGHPSFENMLRSLRNQLLSIPPRQLTHTVLSERNWFHYAARTWEAVKKSTLFAEYNRLLP
ncbi:Protein SMG9 [Lamellibrachia satsuma]|nr:Protein SMG9 [Lamellibrachia satsuma]